MKKKIFVTGAAGFVGSHLVPKLTTHGYYVTALIRSQVGRARLPKETGIVVADLAKEGNWVNKLKGHDILIHLAAEISSKDEKAFRRNNVIATNNLVEAAKKTKIKKIILFSSAAVTSIRRDPYADTKAQQEEIVKVSKIPYHIIRPSMIYGPGDTKNIGWLIKTIFKLPIIPLPGGGKFGRQPVYVDDIAKIVLKLVSGKYKKQIYEIHGRQYVTMAKMIKVILKETNKRRLTLPIPIFFLVLAFWIGEKILQNPKFTVDQIKSLISGEKFKGEKWWHTFDIIPTKFEVGVSKMIKGKK